MYEQEWCMAKQVVTAGRALAAHMRSPLLGACMRVNLALRTLNRWLESKRAGLLRLLPPDWRAAPLRACHTLCHLLQQVCNVCNKQQGSLGQHRSMFAPAATAAASRTCTVSDT